MASGTGKDQDDRVHVKQQRGHQTNPNAAFTTGAPRAAPAGIASPLPPSGVEKPGERRSPGTEGSGSAAAAVNRRGKKVAVPSPPSSSHRSRGSTSTTDAADPEESANASSPLPSPAPPVERVDEQPGQGSRSPGADRKGSMKAALLSPASVFSTSSSADAEVAGAVSRKADEKQVIRPQANEDNFLKKITSLTLAEQSSGNGYDENGFSHKRKLGDKIPLMEFADKYKNNSTFMHKFMVLHEKYSFVREADGDGSCFYRSFMFSYLEKAVAIPDKDVRTNEAIRLRERIEYAMRRCYLRRHRMTDARFERAFSGCEFVMKLIEDGLPAGELYERELADGITSRFLPLLRTLTEIELYANQKKYIVVLPEYPSISEFCAAEVRPDDGEASHPSMMALVNALGIAAVLGCVDMTDGGVEIPLPPETGNVSPVVATLLYMPGHYNVLYAS